MSVLADKKEKKYVSDNAQLMAEWDWEKNIDISPNSISHGSHMKLWWKCSNGHSWQGAVSKRFQGRRCPYCFGTKPLSGFNDLATIHPELANEWDHIKNTFPISEYRPTSNKKAWWICSKGHSWEAAISKRTLGEKCPICQGKKILSGYNDLPTTHPILMLEWDLEKNKGINPYQFGKGSETIVWWICKHKHSWSAPIYSRTSGTGCPICAKELQSSYPEKAIYFYIKKLFPDAISGYKSPILNGLELDIYIPSYDIAIEYDGERWHTDVSRDMEKNNLCEKLGILLIRVREPNCPPLSDSYSKTL